MDLFAPADELRANRERFPTHRSLPGRSEPSPVPLRPGALSLAAVAAKPVRVLGPQLLSFARSMTALSGLAFLAACLAIAPPPEAVQVGTVEDAHVVEPGGGASRARSSAVAPSDSTDPEVEFAHLLTLPAGIEVPEYFGFEVAAAGTDDRELRTGDRLTYLLEWTTGGASERMYLALEITGRTQEGGAPANDRLILDQEDGDMQFVLPLHDVAVSQLDLEGRPVGTSLSRLTEFPRRDLTAVLTGLHWLWHMNGRAQDDQPTQDEAALRERLREVLPMGVGLGYGSVLEAIALVLRNELFADRTHTLIELPGQLSVILGLGVDFSVDPDFEGASVVSESWHGFGQA